MAKNQDEISKEMENFIDYFVETYLGTVGRSGRRGNPRIKIPTWNKFASVLEKVPCTNNGSEAFNGALSRCRSTVLIVINSKYGRKYFTEKIFNPQCLPLPSIS